MFLANNGLMMKTMSVGDAAVIMKIVIIIMVILGNKPMNNYLK
jgi:hypothetical protein